MVGSTNEDGRSMNSGLRAVDFFFNSSVTRGLPEVSIVAEMAGGGDFVGFRLCHLPSKCYWM